MEREREREGEVARRRGREGRKTARVTGIQRQILIDRGQRKSYRDSAGQSDLENIIWAKVFAAGRRCHVSACAHERERERETETDRQRVRARES